MKNKDTIVPFEKIINGVNPRQLGDVDEAHKRWKTFTPKAQAAIVSFRKDVCAKSKQIDPNEERNWYDLSIGYFIAKSLSGHSNSNSCGEAYDAALFVRYKCGYWVTR